MVPICNHEALRLTLHVLAWTMGIQLLLGSGLAWLLARRQFWGKSVLDALVMLPLIFPPILIGYVLLVSLGRQGWLTQLLPDWLQPNLVFSTSGLVVAAVIAGLPLMVKPVQSAFLAIPKRMHEAAATLGEPAWRVFLRIDWPLAKRGIATGLLLSGGRALGEVGISLMLGGNIHGRTETLSLAIYNHVLDGEFTCANELSLVLLGFAAMAFFLLRRYGAF